MPRRTLYIALACALGVNAIGAEPMKKELVHAKSCAIERSIYQSQDHYLIATFEHLGEVQCDDETGCVETLKILRQLAAQKPNGTPFASTIEVLRPARNGAPTLPYRAGLTSIGILVPRPGGELYYFAAESQPADPEVVAIYEEATKVALAAAPGVPDCS
jgi:hypothetical protein